MSARLSNYITGCVRSGRHLLSAFTIEGPRVAASFLEETESHLEEDDAEPRPDGLLVAIERKVRAALDDLVETDHAVAAAAGLESELRQRHRADKRQLAFLIVALRRMVLAQYVEPDMENLGLQPVNVRDGVTIARRAELIDQRFEAANLLKMLGQSRFEEPADLSRFVAEIRAKAADLLKLNGEIDEAHRAADRARIERDRAKDAYDRVYLRGARMFEDMCRFAGLDELADRIRRRKNRPAVGVETVGVETVDVETVDVETVDVENSTTLPDSKLRGLTPPAKPYRAVDPRAALMRSSIASRNSGVQPASVSGGADSRSSKIIQTSSSDVEPNSPRNRANAARCSSMVLSAGTIE